MIQLSQAFTMTSSLFPAIGVSGAAQIPAECKSALDQTPNSMHRVPWAGIEAAGRILCGDVKIHRYNAAQEETVEVFCQSKSGKVRISRINRSFGQYSYVNTETAVRWFMHLIIESSLFGLHDELRERWERLIQAVKGKRALPLSPTNLAQLSHDQEVKGAMYAVLDSLYFTAKTLPAGGTFTNEDLPDSGDYPHTPLLYGGKVAAASNAGTPCDATELRLLRRVQRGLRALLAGPTGTGKTEMAKRIALASGSTLITIKGRPGLEDRDMIGGIYPTAHGARWVDGPLARALRLAMSGQKVTLVQDEVMRLDPYHRNTYVGLMDDVSEVELQASLGVHVAPGRYYMLELNGSVNAQGKPEVLYASTQLLSIIHTTNLGSAYTQSGELDPALKRRFQLVEFVSYPSEAVIMPVYQQACEKAARTAYRLEVATRDMTVEKGQQLTQPMNIGVTLNYLAEVQSLLDDGLSLVKALQEALECTVIPFCCEVGEDGWPDQAGATSLKTTLDRVLRG